MYDVFFLYADGRRLEMARVAKDYKTLLPTTSNNSNRNMFFFICYMALTRFFLLHGPDTHIITLTNPSNVSSLFPSCKRAVGLKTG